MPSIIEALAWEHQAFGATFEQIHLALPNLELADIKRLTHWLEEALLSHAGAEDDLVLLALSQAPEQKRRCERFHQEHLEIDGQLTRLYAVDDLGQATQLLKAVMTHSRRHFQHEERLIFPLIEQIMKDEVLVKLGAVWMLQRQQAGDTWDKLKRFKDEPGRLQGLPLPFMVNAGAKPGSNVVVKSRRYSSGR